MFESYLDPRRAALRAALSLFESHLDPRRAVFLSLEPQQNNRSTMLPTRSGRGVPSLELRPSGGGRSPRPRWTSGALHDFGVSRDERAEGLGTDSLRMDTELVRCVGSRAR